MLCHTSTPLMNSSFILELTQKIPMSWEERLSFGWVRGTRRIIIGGSIGTKGEMGEIIRGEALAYLEAQGLGDIQFLTFAADSDDAGLLGAYQFVRESRG